MATQMLEVILAGNRIATRVTTKESIKTKTEAEIVSVSVLSTVLSKYKVVQVSVSVSLTKRAVLREGSGCQSVHRIFT